jgi:hypothetical protein
MTLFAAPARISVVRRMAQRPLYFDTTASCFETPSLRNAFASCAFYSPEGMREILSKSAQTMRDVLIDGLSTNIYPADWE